MELRQLKHFVAVVECGNLSTAATRLYISQPALTRSIKMLEARMGAKLFDRHPRGAMATAAGQVLYQHAKMILMDCDRATIDIKQVISGVVGTVHIGIGALFSRHVVDTAVERLTEDLGGLEVHVTEGLFEELVSKLREGALDIVFSNLPNVSMPKDVTIEPLCEVAAVVVAGKKNPLARQRRVQLTDLVDSKWVTVDTAHSVEQVEQLFCARGLPVPRIAVRTNSLNLMKALIMDGRFVGMLSEQFLARELRRGLMTPLRLDTPPIVRRAGMVYRNRAYQSAAVAHAIGVLRDECAKVYGAASAAPRRQR